MLTINPTNLIFEDGESPLNIEPLTTYKAYPYGPDVYGEYYVNDDGYIRIKEEGGSVYSLFWGFKFSQLQYVYWGRPINTTSFTYKKNGLSELKSISLDSSNLKKFEYGKYLKNMGSVESVSGNNLTSIIWNDCIEECDIFKSTPNISELRFPNSLNKISGFRSTGTLNDIYFGSELTELSGFWESSAKDIYIKAIAPPNLDEQAFNDNLFIDSKLHVPSGCKSIYSTSNIWSRFWNIIEDEDSGISDVVANGRLDIIIEDGKLYIRGKADANIVSVYNVQGQLIISTYENKIELSTKGVYIIKVGSICKKIIL